MKQRDEVLGVKIVGGLPEAATLGASVSATTRPWQTSFHACCCLFSSGQELKGLLSLPFSHIFLKFLKNSRIKGATQK
jgi:hypothetical protein